MIDQETFERLEKQDWADLYVKLTAYAEVIVQSKAWCRGESALPKGTEPIDFVNEAVKRLYEGTRSWNCEEHPDLLVVLKGIVKSLVSDLLTSAEHRRSADIEKQSSTDQKHRIVVEAGQDEALIKDELLEKCYEAADGEEELETVLMALLEGYSPAEVADELLEVPVSKVYNLNRKLRRRIKKKIKETEVA